MLQQKLWGRWGRRYKRRRPWKISCTKRDPIIHITTKPNFLISIPIQTPTIKVDINDGFVAFQQDFVFLFLPKIIKIRRCHFKSSKSLFYLYVFSIGNCNLKYLENIFLITNISLIYSFNYLESNNMLLMNEWMFSSVIVLLKVIFGLWEPSNQDIW